MKPLCFVLMPFGLKVDKKGRKIDFNKIYELLIRNAIEECGLEAVRADEELLGGAIHKPMFERLILCDYAIADLTSLNPNVFYELGLRHAIKEHTTIPIFAFDADLPFDLNLQRTLPYQLDEQGNLIQPDQDRALLIKQLKACIADKKIDSPMFQLVDGWSVAHNLSHEKTDVFRDQAVYENKIKDQLFEARNTGKAAVTDILDELQPLREKSVGVLVDLFLSLRGVKAWEEMTDSYDQMDPPVQKLKILREQLAFAYNRLGKHARAEKILKEIINEYGTDPETNGLLGRVYKDLYMGAADQGDKIRAAGFLNRAVLSYKEGFDADWRDAYPGINLVTLLGLQGDTELLNRYLPIVRFAVERKIADSEPDYWDKATLSELSVLGQDYDDARTHLSIALTLIPDKEYWMLETTLNNFRLILKAREEKNDEDPGLSELITEFTNYLK